MAQVITLAGEQYFATQAQNNQPLNIDTFIFAYVPGQDPNAEINRNEGLPPLAQRVHQQPVQKVGKINDNVVVYSSVVDSLTGPFEFNWVGLYSAANNVLIAIQKVQTVSKTVTVPGAAGNVLNRNFGIEYSGIADIGNITVDAETWQYDFEDRFREINERIGQKVTQVSHLKALPTTGLVHGQQFSVAGFYEGKKWDRPHLVYDEGRSWADHNVGNVIALGALLAWDGNHADLSNFIGFNGSGFGCFVIGQNELEPFYFGALANGMVDTVPLEAAANSEMTVNFGNEDIQYLVDRQINVNNKSVNFKGDATIVASYINASNYSVFNVKHDFLNIVSVTSINEVTEDYSEGTASGIRVSRLNVSNASQYNKGDVVKIVSDDIISGTDPALSQRNGVFSKVGRVSGNQIFLTEVLENIFFTNVRVARINKNLFCSISGLNFKAVQNFNGTWRQPAILLDGIYKPCVKRINCDFWYGEFLSFRGCYVAKSKNVSAENLLTNAENRWYGYAVVERGCANGRHIRTIGDIVRHVYTTGSSEVSENSENISGYGRTIGTKVIEGLGINCTSDSFNTHPDAKDIHFINCHSVFSIRGRHGTNWHFELRGIDCQVINCTGVGGTGVIMRSTYNHPDSCRGHRVKGFTYKPSPGSTNVPCLLRLDGLAGGRITDIRVSDIDGGITTGSAPLVQVLHADLTLIAPNLKAPQSGASSARVIDISGVSKVELDGGTIDQTGATGTSLRTAKLTGDDCELVIKRTKFIGVESWSAFVDFSNGNSKAILKDIEIEGNPPSFGSGLLNAGDNAIFAASYDVANRLGGSNNIISYERSGPFTILATDISRRLNKNIYFIVKVSEANANLFDISNGVFEGQEITIVNSHESTNDFSVLNQNNIAIFASRLLTVGSSMKVIWLGNKWQGASL